MASLHNMRHGNRIRLLQTLSLVGEADRAALARMTDLSRATVSVCSARPSPGARSSSAVRNQPSRPAAGPAGPAPARAPCRHGGRRRSGHSHVRVALADLSAAVVGERRSRSTSTQRCVALDTAASLVDEVVRAADLDPRRLVGAGMAVASRSTARRERCRRPPRAAAGPASRPEELARRLGVPVRVENDANLGALGEHVQGAARGAQDVVYVKLSTGVGAGLLLDGALYVGSRGTAGELGHVTVVPNGSICRCGNRGCLETVASAGALAATRDRDAAVERRLRDVGRHVGRALAPLCMALDLELVVVGGELGTGSRGLVGAARSELRKTCAATAPVTVRPALLGDRAEVLGAVALALGQEEWLRRAGLITINGAGAMSERRVATG